ncbi:MAG TPA: 3-phosphoshikimate 1-carboxyvinyltransferase [Acidimicrobiia bacterium]|nr:3-phosphoshikimate 1-carboxyvinyltransferase [Acidimicrobiia bacterium]
MSASANEITVGGARPLRGRLRVPGDKSISHRALLFAAIADGRSTVTGLATGDDVASSRAAIELLGVRAKGTTERLTITASGFDGLREPGGVVDCGNSGTSMRVLSGLLAGRPFLSVLDGDASLRQRPMARVVEPLRAMGATIDARADGTLAPIAIRGGGLRGGSFTPSVASAQVKSALVLAGLQASGPIEITELAPSRDHTERMLAALGAPVTVGDGVVRVGAGQPQAFELAVPGDPSSAAFFVVAACITPGSELVIDDVALNPSRIAFVDVLRRMGADIDVEEVEVRVGEPVGSITVRAADLHGTEIAGAEVVAVQDEIPALAVAAAFADGVTDIRDAAELRVKESDRIGTVEQELGQLGIGVESRADGLAIRGGRPQAATMKGHGDHRIAMAAAIAGHAIEADSTVRGWSIAAVSYPTFLDDLASVTGGGHD